MRVLFTCLPFLGHVHPLVPLARALADAGHAVAFATGPSLCPLVEANGCRAFPTGFDPQGRDWFGLFPRLRAVPPGPERTAWFEGRIFGFMAECATPDLLRVAAGWRPDVIVREPWEYGGCVAAEYLGLPHATAGVGAFHPADYARSLRAPVLNRLRRAYGLPDDPDLAMLYRYLHLALVPPRFQDPAVPLPPTAHAVRLPPFDRSGAEGLPSWVAALPARPTVYATLGTVANAIPGVFEAILAGLRDEAVNLIVTVGRNQDPSRFGPQPANVHIARYIPQTLLLPRCDLAVAHAGWNTVVACLHHGVPMVLVPFGADMPENARRGAALGVARTIAPSDLTPETVRAAVRAVLADPAYRRNAEGLRDAMAALPGMDHAVALLERLAAERRPIVAAG